MTVFKGYKRFHGFLNFKMHTNKFGGVSSQVFRAGCGQNYKNVLIPTEGR